VYLTYAAPGGHALIDRELYLPRCWITDPARCAAAGIPPGRTFATRPELARAMICRALGAAIPAGWVAGDEVYGAGPGLRAELEACEVGYVLAIASLLTTAALPPGGDARHRMRWSAWRRRHQHTARACHYRRQAAHDP